MSNPYERIDQLERDLLQVRKDQAETCRMCNALALGLQQQSATLAELLSKLGESADALPGEQVERQRHGRTKAN